MAIYKICISSNYNSTSKGFLNLFIDLSQEVHMQRENSANAIDRSTTKKRKTFSAVSHFSDSTASTSAGLTEEEKFDLISNARSVSRIVKWSDCLVRSENGLLCTSCGVTIFYDFSVGEDFIEDALPRQFRHLKYGVKRHLESNRHNQNVSKTLKEKQDELLLEKNSKESALNCAASAYLSFKLDTSYATYETIITEMHNSGASMGVKNHSKEFARNFLPHVHKILRQEVTNFIIENDLPIGLLADKITINHHTRHIIGIRIPIFDKQRDYVSNTIFRTSVGR